MSKETMSDSAVNCIEKHTLCILTIVLAMVLVFAVAFDFGRIDTITADLSELARLTASITFPMSGILLFVLNQSLDFREKYGVRYEKDNVHYPIPRIVNTYTCMGVISAITLVMSAITGLLSFQYFKSGGDMWLTVSLYFFLSVLILLIVNTIFFTIYTMNIKKTIRTRERICNE
ncbi:MAG: hypothetical protein LBH62_05635 [Nitrososphaerota archaeon]|jgi:hypothetical protein|nr:hypothetical protein [Nitrososphaerota archaeon]